MLENEVNRKLSDQISSINYHTKSHTMAVKIKQAQDDQYLVNGKLVYLDLNNKWIAAEDMTVKEIREFRKHVSTEETKKGIVENQNTETPER